MQSKRFFLKLFTLMALAFGLFQMSYAADSTSKILCVPGTEISKACSVNDFALYAKNIGQAVVLISLAVGILLFMVFTTKDMLSVGVGELGQAQMITNTKKRAKNMVIGVILLAFAFGAYKIFSGSIDEEYLKYMKNILSVLFSVEHAYAAGPPSLIAGGPANIFSLFFQFIWNWLVLPITVICWFFVGTKYVTAQGRPEKIKEAHTFIMIVGAVTLMVVFTQGMLFALKDAIFSFF